MTDCEREWSGADLAIQNAGGIRSDMASGPVTLRAIYNIMPFDNRMVKLKMSGRLVRDLLDHGVGKSKGMIQLSGAEFSYSRDKDPGRRLAGVLLGGQPPDLLGQLSRSGPVAILVELKKRHEVVFRNPRDPLVGMVRRLLAAAGNVPGRCHRWLLCGPIWAIGISHRVTAARAPVNGK